MRHLAIGGVGDERPQALPEFLRHEGHVRMQKPQAGIEDVDEDGPRVGVAGRGPSALLVATQAHLRHLDVPVAVLVPEEVVDALAGLVQLRSARYRGRRPP